MIFGLFGSKKEDRTADLYNQYAISKKVLESLARIKSLQVLGRNEESQALLVATENLATDHLRKHPRDKLAHDTLLMFYSGTAAHEKATELLTQLLNSNDLGVTEDDRKVYGAELQKLQREQPSRKETRNTVKGYTHVYCCMSCGRLINYVTMPCPNCKSLPRSKDELARAMVISNQFFKIQQLILLSRQMENGRYAEEIVPNLVKESEAILRDPDRTVDKMYTTSQENEGRTARDMSMLRECAKCGCKIWFSALTECSECKEPLHLPDAVQFMICLDILLQYFEKNVDVQSTEAFSEFVCIVVKILGDLLRNQQPPSDKVRYHALTLLKSLGQISCGNGGGIIETKNPQQLEVSLVKDRLTEESEMTTKMLSYELKLFVDRMVGGVGM